MVLAIFSLESCSLQRLFKRNKLSVSRLDTIKDTTGSANTAVKRYALFPQPDTASYNNINLTAQQTEKQDSGKAYALYPQPDTFSEVKNVDGIEATNKLISGVLPLFKNIRSYTTFNGKAKVHFEGPGEQQDFTAIIRLKKDTALWINIFGLGGVVNAARVYITRDSFFMINYLQKEVTKIALAQVAKVLPTEVDFMSLQRLITGEPLREGTIVDVAELSNSWLLHVTDPGYLQELQYNKSDSTLSTCLLNTHDPNGPQALMKYADFELLYDKKFSKARNINIKNGADQFAIEMYFQNADFDKPIEMPFNIPGNYTVK